MEERELEEIYVNEIKIGESKDGFYEMRDIRGWSKEVFVALYLDTKARIISREILSVGILDSAVIHPREVFRNAISRNAYSVIIVHNHPSGDCLPSVEDKEATRQIKEAGKIIGIKLLDHVIVSKDNFYSFSDKNEM